tara:strand:+ start:305 stop:1159 length:855 start_codon:yes stop_codon:yes gene_type:complete
MDEMLYLDSLRKEHAKFCENIQTYTVKCKCCGADAPYLGDVDFSKTCHDRYGKKVFQNTGCDVPYQKCENCGFIFSTYADNWTSKEMKKLIYNEEYNKSDGVVPGWEEGLSDPRKSISYLNGEKLIQNYGLSKEQNIRILDYGSGGNPGNTGLCFLDKGFDLTSYDPYSANGDTNIELKHDKYDFIYSIEVFEHVVDLGKLCRFMSSHLSDTGMLHIQTLLHPNQTDHTILDSWYISPKNGHFSIFTFVSIFILFKSFGINVMNSPFGLVGFKNKPLFKNNIFV